MNNLDLSVILFEPEIPPNTGNIIRLCANNGFGLHLVRPLGFPLDDTKLRRAGLDYHEYATLVVHDDWFSCQQSLSTKRIIAIETCGDRYYHQFNFKAGDCLLFGSETRGLPKYVLDSLNSENIIRLPMCDGQRSLNLSNSVAITTYEAWRQLGFLGGI